MEFLKNINKEFILSKEYDLIKNEYRLKLKDGISNDIKIKIVGIDLETIEFSIDISDLGNISEKISDELVNSLTREYEKTRIIANKILDAWDKTPEKFIKKDTSWGKVVYEYVGLLKNVEYHQHTHLYFEKISEHGMDFTTGCGGDTFYSKSEIEEQIKKEDIWFPKTVKMLKDKKTLKRIENYVSKRIFSISIKQFIKYVSIPGTQTIKEKVKVKKPKFPIKFTGDDLNTILDIFSDHILIDDEFIQDVKSDSGVDISVLMDWEITEGTDGYHNTDGDHCDYEVCFTSPDGHEYKFYNTHCLITGYNFYGNLKAE